MASLGLAPDELKQLDLIRNRFHQLSNSLISLQHNVNYTTPLPSRESLQASATILLQNINSIQVINDEYADLFQRIAVHPSTNYPGRTHENILLHLLRKKLEPDIEGLVEDARKSARSAGLDASKLGAGQVGGGYGEGEDEDGYGIDQEGDVPADPFNELWADVWDACNEGVVDYIENQAREGYTVEEQEMGTKNVRTGLKRSLEDESDEEEDEDEEDEDEEMGGVAKAGPVTGQTGPARVGVVQKKPAMEPEQLLWFVVRGDMKLPPHIELESQRKAKDSKKRPGQR